METQSPNVESSGRKNELLWQSTFGTKKMLQNTKKVKVKNIAFLYQTTPARLNAADCPFNPTSTMPLPSLCITKKTITIFLNLIVLFRLQKMWYLRDFSFKFSSLKTNAGI